MIKLSKPILQLSAGNGGGFVATESQDGGQSWFFRGDIGAVSRAFWRSYARLQGYELREVRYAANYRRVA